ARVGDLPERVVRRHRDRDLGEAGGRTVGRDAAVGVVLRGAHVAVGRTTRGERLAQVVATRIAEHLERAVAVHVPAEAEARRPLWRSLPHVGLAAAVVVGEAVVAQADGRRPAEERPGWATRGRPDWWCGRSSSNSLGRW